MERLAGWAVKVVDEGLCVSNPRESGGMERDKWAKGKACWGGVRGE